eukprot:TRINITY_DN568_c0_g1_i1.p1 TRINITY_DN568_c0_g1~~TRINITY_DN568_c0_g1_i1.p1  ORF type:complete len:293 (+),score=60.50 TRINITY_DN568_c0_g1_i1:1146-2024(+)
MNHGDAVSSSSESSQLTDRREEGSDNDKPRKLGSAIAPYVQPIIEIQHSTVKAVSITAMREYKGMSLEEIRFEDMYQRYSNESLKGNRKLVNHLPPRQNNTAAKAETSASTGGAGGIEPSASPFASFGRSGSAFGFQSFGGASSSSGVSGSGWLGNSSAPVRFSSSLPNVEAEQKTDSRFGQVNAGKWQCPTCLTHNLPTDSHCPCCDTSRPSQDRDEVAHHPSVASDDSKAFSHSSTVAAYASRSSEAPREEGEDSQLQQAILESLSTTPSDLTRTISECDRASGDAVGRD